MSLKIVLLKSAKNILMKIQVNKDNLQTNKQTNILYQDSQSTKGTKCSKQKQANKKNKKKNKTKQNKTENS